MTSLHINPIVSPGDPAQLERRKIGFGQLMERLWLFKWLILSLSILGLLAGMAYNFLSTPVYSADIVMQIGQLEDISTGAELGEDLTVLGKLTPFTAELQVLRSRKLLNRVVDEFQLNIESGPKHLPILGEAVSRWRESRHTNQGETQKNRMEPFLPKSDFWERLPGNYSWGGTSITVEDLQVPFSERGKKLLVKVLPDNKFSLLNSDSVQIASGSIGQLATSSQIDSENYNILISNYQANIGDEFTVVDAGRFAAVEQLRDNLRITELGEESGIVRIELRNENPATAQDILSTIADHYIKQKTDQKLEVVEKNLAFLEERLPTVKSDLERYEAELNEFRLLRGSVDFNTETQNTLKRIVTIESEIQDLNLKRRELRTRYTAQHPNVVSIDSQINLLNRELTGLEISVNQMPQMQQQMLSLTRDVDVNSALYTELLSRAQELKIAMASATSDVSILDTASVSAKPVKPKKLLSLILSLILGFFTGVFLALFKGSLRQGIEDPYELEFAVKTPVIATIPSSAQQKKIANLATNRKSENVLALAEINPDDTSVEALRNLRTTLFYRQNGNNNNIVLITGASPNVGKSFVSLNLAIILANSKKSVVLVDADMRRGEQHEAFSLAPEPGISDCVTKGLLTDDVLKTTPVQGLSFVARGTTPTNPSELLLSREFTALLLNLSIRYDYVIVDAPPVLAAADAGIIGNIADTTLLVVKSGNNPLREIVQCKRQLLQNSVELTGIVVNNIMMTGKSKSYGGYVYQYSSK